MDIIIVIFPDRSSDRLLDNIETFSVLCGCRLHVKSMDSDFLICA